MAAGYTVLNSRTSATVDSAQRSAAPAAAGVAAYRRAPTPLVFIATRVASLSRSWRSGIQRFLTVEVVEHGQLVRLMRERKPAVLLLDLELPGLGGVKGIAPLRNVHPPTRIVALAGRPDEKEGVAALKLGAKGYCDRAISAALLAKAVDAVLAGEIWIGRKLTSHLLDEVAALAQEEASLPPAPQGNALFARLTPRERDILQLLGMGASNKEISQRLSVTERTVKAHLTAVFRKLGISSRVQAALLALEASRAAGTGPRTNVQLTE